VSAGGSLSAVGTADDVIVFKPAAGAAWDGIQLDDDSISNTLAYCEVIGVSGSCYAINLDPDAKADIQHCLVHGNSGGGISAQNCASGTIIKNNRLYANGLYGLAVCDQASFDSTNSFAAVGSTVDLSNAYNRVFFTNDISDPNRVFDITEVPYVLYGASGYMKINDGASLTVKPGVSLLFKSTTWISVAGGGTLSAVGTESALVQFSGTTSADGWGGIRLDDDSIATTLEYCKVSGAHAAYAVTFDGVDIKASITNCTIEGNEAGGIDASTAIVGTVINNNTFGDNGDAAGGPYDLYYNDKFTPTGNTFSSSHIAVAD
jgi:hypothetical protein